MAGRERIKYVIHKEDGSLEPITASSYTVKGRNISFEVGYRHYRMIPKEDITKIEKIKTENPTIV